MLAYDQSPMYISKRLTLEVAQGKVASGGNLERDPLTSTTSVADDRVAVTRSY